MNIIETVEELQSVKNDIEGEGSIWFPMWVDSQKHPMNSNLSFIFIRSSSDYILPLNHTDTLSLSLSDIEPILNTPSSKWVFQKKKLLHIFNSTSNLLDADTSYFLGTKEVIDYETPFQPLLSHYYHKGYRDDLIQSIPILKLGEVIQNIISSYTLSDKNFSFDWYNSTFIPTLARIERYGIRVGREDFFDRFPHATKHLTPSNRIYTEYNPFTLTGRPSNRHGGINFAALNKGDGSRECFLADEGDIFLQMDYDAYHPRIIGKLVGYELPQTSVHQWLAEQYGTTYEEGKGITFRLLYGGIDDEFKSIPFFLSVDNYITQLWDRVKDLGYLETKYRRIPIGWIENPNPQKVFNYLLQALETELNMDKMVKVLDYIEDMGIGVSLYTYDSFLLSVPMGVDTFHIKKLKEIIEGGGFPIKAEWGLNYGKV